MAVRTDDLSAEITARLKTYSSAVMNGIRSAARRASAEMTENIIHDSPVRTGKYQKGWKVKEKTDRSGSGFTLTTYNKAKPGLTHILEKGRYIPATGTRVNPVEHIAVNEKAAVRKYLREVDRIIQNGGE